MNYNCYLILELEFDPPVENQMVIDQRIEEKSKFWSRNNQDFKNGKDYQKYSHDLAEIKRIMSDPVERKKQAEAACNDVYTPLDQHLNILGRGGNINEDVVEKVASKHKVSVDVIKKRAAALRIKITKVDVDFHALYEKYYNIKPKQAATFENQDINLRVLNKNDYYDFLNPDEIKNYNNLPCDTFKQRVSEMMESVDFKKANVIASSGKKLCSACMQAFEDEDSKRIYDEYLAWSVIRRILDDAKVIAKMVDGDLPNEQGDDYIGQLTEKLKDGTLAKNVFIAFCKHEKIVYNYNTKNETNENIKVCRCGRINDVSKGSICSNCGLELVIKCPKCGTENDANTKVCQCRFEFKNIDRALALCNLAQQYINSMDFEVAEAHLNDAERYWSGSSEVKAKRKELGEYKQRIGNVAVNMRIAVQEKCYYEAKKQYADIKKKFPKFNEGDLEAEITTAIEIAKSYYDKAKAQSPSNEKEIIENCVKAHESCCDYPGIRELISRYPPQMPANLRISTDGNTKTNILSWNESTSEGAVFYSIVRKKDSVPINNTDGDLVSRVNVCSINDSKILPGVGYYYAIFAERAGVYSKPLSTRRPDVNLFEIENVTITPGDAMLQLEWDPIHSGSAVELFRIIDGGKEERINSNNSEGYLDSSLKNDKNYNYRLRLIYNVNGQRQMTNGVKISGMPTKPPKAIEILSVKPVEDNTFQATWENPDNSNVQLYCSTNRPEYKCGEIVSQATLESKMRRLALTNPKSNSGTFQFKDDGRLYITAVVVKSQSAVIGEITSASKGESVTIKNIAAVNNRINIFIDVPKGATGFVVLYRFDQYPIDISDVESIRQDITLQEYQDQNVLVIRNLKQQNYYFSVFAEFIRDGEKDYSTGTNYQFVNASKEVITYSISVTKKKYGFGENSLKIYFETEEESFILPDIDIYSAIGNVPMFKKSAKLFYSITKQPVTGLLQVKIPLSKNIERETHIKAFLKNDALQSSYKLQLKVNSNCKVR